jgi:hypothetical protein
METPMIQKGSVILDETGQCWEAHVDNMLESCSHIIALRGAGSFNGISSGESFWPTVQRGG